MLSGLAAGLAFSLLVPAAGGGDSWRYRGLGLGWSCVSWSGRRAAAATMAVVVPHGSAGATGGGGSGGVAGPVGGAGGGGALPPGAAQPPICEADGWCWMNPLPQGRHLRAVWAASPGDVWAGVMAPGRFLHRGNDGIWTSVSSGVEIFATAIWGSGPSSVWAVGAFGPGVILHWDGVRWSEVYRAADSLEDIRGTGPDRDTASPSRAELTDTPA